mmetsp:Transcript_62899/g.175837  ORF Transcript_62899/g.175837 Transcript_62899/m.175837 type:complete len:215 (+) Transcript_62899:264-908(+)
MGSRRLLVRCPGPFGLVTLLLWPTRGASRARSVLLHRRSALGTPLRRAGDAVLRRNSAAGAHTWALASLEADALDVLEAVESAPRLRAQRPQLLLRLVAGVDGQLQCPGEAEGAELAPLHVGVELLDVVIRQIAAEYVEIPGGEHLQDQEGPVDETDAAGLLLAAVPLGLAASNRAIRLRHLKLEGGIRQHLHGEAGHWADVLHLSPPTRGGRR